MRTQSVSFRRVRVVQEPLVDQEGLTFLFEVNNIRIFCGGMRNLSFEVEWKLKQAHAPRVQLDPC